MSKEPQHGADFQLMYDLITQMKVEHAEDNEELREVLDDMDSIVGQLQDQYRRMQRTVARTLGRLSELEHSHAALSARVDRHMGQEDTDG